MRYKPGKVYENVSAGRTAVIIKSFKYYYIDATYKNS